MRQKEAAFVRPIDEDFCLPASEPRDQRIARLLWLWAHDPKQPLDDGRDVAQHIGGWLEVFLCDSFSYWSQGAKEGWWSDGVFDLRIDRFDSTAFLAYGATWWAGHKVNEQWVAPFEIEFHFKAVNDLDFARTIIRFGLIDDTGNIKRSSSALPSRFRNDGRPIPNSAWAMAIELTPPENA